jgi:hypothetical protein
MITTAEKCVKISQQKNPWRSDQWFCCCMPTDGGQTEERARHKEEFPMQQAIPSPAQKAMNLKARASFYCKIFSR